jgi:hypothetical protein
MTRLPLGISRRYSAASIMAPGMSVYFERPGSDAKESSCWASDSFWALAREGRFSSVSITSRFSFS